MKRKKAGKTFFSAAVAYHEAGHAVARVYLGARVTDTKVFKDGTGFSDGAVAEWRSANAGAGQSWDLLLMLMAGVHAEARATKRSLKVLRLSKGLQDFAIATVLVDMMARHSKKLSAKAIWRQADRERAYFLRHCWHTIERVGAQLMRTGFVSAADLKRMTKSYRRHQLAQRPCL